MESNTDTDVGRVVELQSHDNGWNAVIKEEGSEYEIGIPIYREDLAGFFPCVGDRIELEGLSEGAITRLKINERVIFSRSYEEALTWNEIRKSESKVRFLREQLRNGIEHN